MIAHLRGRILEKNPSRVILEAAGVGYEFIRCEAVDRLLIDMSRPYLPVGWNRRLADTAGHPVGDGLSSARNFDRIFTRADDR